MNQLYYFYSRQLKIHIFDCSISPEDLDQQCYQTWPHGSKEFIQTDSRQAHEENADAE